MKCTLFMTMSLDGFTARADDSTPWSDAEWAAYAELVKSKGCIIVGRRTYELMSAVGEFEKLGFPFVVVLSETRSGSPDGKTHFARTPEEAIAVLRGQGYTDVLVGGGSRTNTSFLVADLLQEVVIDIEPVRLSNGKGLFESAAPWPALHLKSATCIGNTVVRLHYLVRPSQTGSG